MGCKKSSVSVSVSRPHLTNACRVPVACSLNVYRQRNGHLGSSSAYTVTQAETTSGSNLDNDQELDSMDLGADLGTDMAPEAASGDTSDQDGPAAKPSPVTSAT
jgi:hypothetical protein